MGQRLPIVIMFSGNGSNMQAIMDRCDSFVKIKGVVTDNPFAYGIHRAAKANLPTIVHVQKPDETREQYCEMLASEVRVFEPELIVLAGFMKILTPNFIQSFSRSINIHPSLLPKFKGLDTHKRVLEAYKRGEVNTHGVTIHWVNEELDSGPIIMQDALDIREWDTEETLEARIHELEHMWYPWTITKIAAARW